MKKEEARNLRIAKIERNYCIANFIATIYCIVVVAIPAFIFLVIQPPAKTISLFLNLLSYIIIAVILGIIIRKLIMH